MKNKSYIISILIFFLPVLLYAQNKIPILERTISIRLNNVKVDAALAQVATQGGFTFSYNPSIIDINRTVNLTITKKTIREVIILLFNGKIEAKAKSNYLILAKAKSELPKTDDKNETFIVSGYILNETGEKLPWASIYNKKSLASAVSNSYGFYAIELPRKLTELSLNVSKKEYLDTIVQLADNSNQFLSIILPSHKKDTTIAVTMDSLYESAEKNARSFFMTEEDYANSKNIKDTIYRVWQASLVPFIGSNGRLSGNVINDYSLNLFGGYSLGVRKLELAGFFNVTRSDVQYCQLAGFANGVGGNVRGCQLAGFVNTVRKDVTGIQGAGFVNFTWGKVNGVQLAGFVNSARGKSKCGQAAGFVNTVIDTTEGFQAAGFVNVAVRNYKGLQTAGFLNVGVHNFTGVQVSGFCNVAAHDFTGTQVTGFVNVAVNKMTGTQIGVVNYAKQVNGTQVGFFNYAKTYSGIPVGFLSYVNSGYHKLEVSADEVFYTNLAFRSGVKAFHNIITAGVNPGNFNTPLWTFGYGLGSTITLGKKVGLDIDLTSSQVVKQNNFDKINLLNKAYVGLDIPLAKKMSLAIGGTVNGQLTKTGYSLYPELFTDITPNIFYVTNYSSGNLDLKMWLGGKIALRFF